MFAEQFGMNPDEVDGKVNIETWMQWQMWMKAKTSREIWQVWRSPGEKNFDASQQRLFNWPVGEGY